jgi:carbon monoxide dehydrogenase subunit G
VVVESDDNIIKYIETNVSGNVLEIKTNHSMGFNNAHYKVFITAPAINSIEASGAANIKAKDQLKSSGKISFDISGAAEVTASVDAPEVEVEISGAGNMDLSGRTRSYKAKVTGSGDLKAADFLSENADVDVSGAGSAKVHASVSLKAEASGAGNISYKGGASVQQKTSGAGTIKSDN